MEPHPEYETANFETIVALSKGEGLKILPLMGSD